jgi:competence protein ComEC
MKVNIGSLLNFYLFVFFAIGIILGFYFPFFIAFLVLAAISIFAVIFFYRKKKLFLSDLFILLFFIFLGALWVLPSSYYKRDDFLKGRNKFCLKVISLPQDYKNKAVVSAAVNEVNGLPVKFKVKVMDFTKELKYLNSYRLPAKLSKKNFAGKNFYSLWVKSDAQIKQLPTHLWDRFSQKTSDYVLRVFKSNLGDTGYRFLASVFLGRRELLGKERQSFADTGVSHLLAISGLHIGLTSLILFFILRFFGIGFRARLMISMVFLFVYTFISGASASTIRALIMYIVFALGFFAKRKVNLFNSLGLAGLISLLINPLLIFEIGFQLSFIAVFSIILGFKVFKVKQLPNQALNYLMQIIICSVFVTLFLTPLTSYYFDKIYILSIFYNAILIPFFTLILGLNFLLIILSPFHLLAQSLGAILSLAVSLFVGLVNFLGSIRFSFVSFTFSVWGIGLYYSLLAALFSFFAYKRYNE